jgi:inner membrane protein
MDNLTHTLIGTLVGETVARMSRPDPAGLTANARRNLIVVLSAVGSNLPDLDLLYSFFGSKANYLAHHRGHTHTIVGALLLAAIAYVITMQWLRRRGMQLSSQDRVWAAGTLVAMALLHLGMDFTNNYGVHPFWPFNDRWFYGDAVFIIEPLIWAACAPLALLLRTRLARAIVGAILVLGVALSIASGFVPAPAIGALAIVIVGMLVLTMRVSASIALLAGIALWGAITATALTASRLARGRSEQLASEFFPRARLLEAVLTPLPANPLCWETTLVQEERDQVVLRRAVLALAPQWLAPSQCVSRSLSTTAPLQAVPAPDNAAVIWSGQVSTRSDDLRQVAKSNCEAAAAMTFMRAPWIAAVGDTIVLGDLRYDREVELGFAEFELTQRPPGCPFMPPWQPPRADILYRQAPGQQAGTRLR